MTSLSLELSQRVCSLLDEKREGLLREEIKNLPKVSSQARYMVLDEFLVNCLPQGWTPAQKLDDLLLRLADLARSDSVFLAEWLSEAWLYPSRGRMIGDSPRRARGKGGNSELKQREGLVKACNVIFLLMAPSLMGRVLRQFSRQERARICACYAQQFRTPDGRDRINSPEYRIRLFEEFVIPQSVGLAQHRGARRLLGAYFGEIVRSRPEQIADRLREVWSADDPER